MFYGFAMFVVYCFFYHHSNKVLLAMLYAVLIIFIASEFWEIPIFIRGYLDFSNYGFPQVLNHVIVGFDAFLLITYSNFKLDKVNGLVLIVNLAINTFFLWTYVTILISWFLRSLTIICLSYIFLREVRKND